MSKINELQAAWGMHLGGLLFPALHQGIDDIPEHGPLGRKLRSVNPRGDVWERIISQHRRSQLRK